MIERYLYTALQSGLDLFKQRPGLFSSLFTQLYGLSGKETEAAQKVFLAHPPRILHTYAPTPADVPCYAIDVMSEAQTQSLLANSAGYAAPQQDQGTQPVFTNLWRHNYSVKCCAFGRDTAEYLYEMAKFSVYLQLLYLVRHNLDQIQLGGGPLRDMYPQPDRFFMRELSFSCVREFRFFPPLGEPLRRQVDGLFIADDRPNGGVAAKINVTSAIV